MNATFKQSGKKGVVTLEGDLTLPHAEALKGIFLKALQRSDDVTIAMENVHNADLSSLQLFRSAHRSAARVRNIWCSRVIRRRRTETRRRLRGMPA